MISTFIFVEDGSVDVDELQEKLGDDVKIIAYRQGSAMPTVLQLEKPVKCFLDDCSDEKKIIGTNNEEIQKTSQSDLSSGNSIAETARSQENIIPAVTQSKKSVKIFIDDQDRKIYEPTKQALIKIKRLLCECFTKNGIDRDRIDDALKVIITLQARFFGG